MSMHVGIRVDNYQTANPANYENHQTAEAIQEEREINV